MEVVPVAEWSGALVHAADGIVISPGPGLPRDFPSLRKIYQQAAGRVAVLGICLGLQALADTFGGGLKNLSETSHGKLAQIAHSSAYYLFRGLPSPFEAGLYHSWAVDEQSFPDVLEVTCRDGRGIIMGARHREYKLEAVQFHPESYLTPGGRRILENWVSGLDDR